MAAAKATAFRRNAQRGHTPRAASAKESGCQSRPGLPPRTRRAFLGHVSLLAAAVAPWKSSAAAQEMCDEECTKELDKKEVVTTPSGLQYRVIEEGSGAKMQPGYQAVTDWVAYNQEGKLFENSIAEGRPRDVRVTGASDSRNIIAGLDEGILSMRVGEKRRLYIPGYLAYQRGLKAAPGRPAIPPKSPLVIDVHLRYVPGLEME